MSLVLSNIVSEIFLKIVEINIGFVKGHGKARFEKWVFRESSFIEDVIGGLPSISVDENDIISKTEISEDEFNIL